MKKIFLALMCLVCILALLAGCSDPGANTPTEPTGRKTITIGTPESALVLDYDTNAYTLWLEEVSGYDIEFVMYATGAADYAKQIATETANQQKMPDILWRFNLNADVVNQYGEDGYFIDLSPYFNDREKSANYWNMVEKYLTEEEQSRVWTMLHTADRNEDSQADSPIYCYPTLETTMIDTMDFMPLINQKWLDNLKLKAPTTLAELKQVLIAFRDQDPNGNNKKDEIPMLGSTNTLGGGLIEWIINFYIYYDDSHYFNVGSDGQLYYPQVTEQYRDALRFIRELIDEKLLHANTLTASHTDLRTYLQNTDLVGVTVNHPSLVFTSSSKRFLNWEALDLYGNAYDNSNAFRKNCFITDSCEDPDAAWDLLMHMCTEESAFRLRYGVQGTHWDWADEGTTSVMGIPAIIKVYDDIWGSTNNFSWMGLAGGVYPYSENECNQVTGQESDFLKHKYQVYQDLRANFDRAVAAVDKSQVCPWLYFNEEEDDISKNRASLKKEVDTWRAYFVTREKDLDSEADWNEYLSVLKEAGMDEYRAAAQMCYERMYKSGT